MLSINMDDVMQVVSNIQNYLIAFGVVLVLALLVMFAVRKMPKAKKKMIRAQSGLAILLALAIVVNLICTGPMSTILDLVSGEGSISEETSAEATELVNEITQEGIVLAQNDDNILPVASGSKLNVFGWASTSPCYGGTGTGALNDIYPVTDLLTGLHDAGIETNDELSKFYTDYCSTRPSVGMAQQDWTLPEPNVSLYTDEMMANAKEYSDTAMVVITRVGGEGADLPTDMSAVVDGSWVRRVADYRGSQRGAGYYNGTYDDSLNEGNDWDKGDHFLQLSNREEELIDLVTSNFDNVVVVYNGANAFEMDWVKDYPQIKGVLLCPGTGQSGFEGFGRVVAGEVNPSGRTADTYAADLTASPWWNNFGDFKYTNATELDSDSSFFDPAGATASFVNYVEGIYVGYKFYETAAAEGLIDYDKTVQYPFGHGLSYTTFTQKIDSMTEADGTITLDVTVTNTGSVAGKDAVQVYFNPPYTDGGIEKASTNLVTFGKTDSIEPGASQTLTLTFNTEDMASFDSKDKGCYVLEEGDYIISINEDSHTVLDSKTYNVASTIVYDESNPRSTDAEAATTKFDFADDKLVTLSRAGHFANYAEAVAVPSDFTMSEESMNTLYNDHNWTPEDHNDPNDEMPVTGANNGLKLADLRGADYDDERWDTLLDQMTVTEMDDLIALGGYQTKAEASVDKYATIDCDGPVAINNNFTGVSSIGFPSEIIIASTFNTDLARRYGESIGRMASEMNVTGWYAPAMNGHRSAFDGRNFEYYSEDSVLAGYIGASSIAGAQSYGVYAYMKHFALNDQQINQSEMLCTWADEQAIREIYLRPFEISAKVGGCKAVMSSWNYIGNQWTGACNALLNGVLRGEWGFRGMVITDGFHFTDYMDSDIAIRNGCDLMLKNYDVATNHLTDTTSATSVKAMRQACKNIMYTVVNSRVYDPANTVSTPIWRTAMIVVNVLLAVLLVVLEVLTFKSYKKKKAQ